MNVQHNRSGSNNNNLECKTDFGERNEQNMKKKKLSTSSALIFDQRCWLNRAKIQLNSPEI